MPRADAYTLCRSWMNRGVRVHTVYGDVHEGVIVNVDDSHVYLRVSNHQHFGYHDFGGYNMYCAYYNPNETILTLSLYVLLSIVLLA